MPLLQALAYAPVLLVAAMLRSERRLIAALQRSEATAPDRAIALPRLNPLARLRYQRLASLGAIRAAADGRCYLDSVAWNAYRARRRVRAGYAVLVAIAIVLIALSKLR